MSFMSAVQQPCQLTVTLRTCLSSLPEPQGMQLRPACALSYLLCMARRCWAAIRAHQILDSRCAGRFLFAGFILPKPRIVSPLLTGLVLTFQASWSCCQLSP